MHSIEKGPFALQWEHCDYAMAEYISVGEALKILSPFKGDKMELLDFISNVDRDFEVINPENAEILYKFVLTRISGEPTVAIIHRHLENWGDLKTFLNNTYTEKRTLDFHATQLFGARQSKNEKVSEWIQKIERLSSKFREAALHDCEEDERVGFVALADKLRNIFSCKGLYQIEYKRLFVVETKILLMKLRKPPLRRKARFFPKMDATVMEALQVD